MNEQRLDESLGSPLQRIVKELPNPQRIFAGVELAKVNDWELSPVVRLMAKDAIIRFGRDSRLDSLADAAKDQAIPGLKDA